MDKVIDNSDGTHELEFSINKEGKEFLRRVYKEKKYTDKLLERMVEDATKDYKKVNLVKLKRR